MLRAADIHDRIDWPTVLQALGIGDAFLVNRHGPCPACGGQDRFRFDNKRQRGDFYCNGCGAGDGFALLMRVHGWTFAEARREVLQAGRLDTVRPRIEPAVVQAIASPTARVRGLLRSAANPADVPDVVAYLQSRGLWPLPAGCTLRAHAAAEYWRTGSERPQCVGRFPALLAEVRDTDGEVATLHATYLHDGRKLDDTPRKILSSMVGRMGCSARLMPIESDVLGVAEGVETSLAASRLHGMPVWAALNAGLLAKFEPPPEVSRVVIFADRDVAGLEAALTLTARLDGRATVETRIPRADDWADQLVTK